MNETNSMPEDPDKSKTLRLPWIAGFVLAWSAITATRFEVISSPPYYDFAVGLWMEAHFLAENNFDYAALHRAPLALSEHFGPRIYMTSILPSIAAIGIWLSPDSSLGLILFHSVTFAFAALVFISMVAILYRRLGLLVSVLIGIACLLTPVFSAQIDMLGMEVPLAAFATLTAYSLSRSRYLLAVLMAFGAFAMKSTGLIVLIALSCYLASLFITTLLTPRRLERGIFWQLSALVLCVVTLFVEWQILEWSGTFSRQLLSGMPLTMMLVWSPDLVLLIAFILVVGGFLSLRWYLGTAKTMGGSRLRRYVEALNIGLRGEAATVFSLICSFGILLAISTGPHLPRYLAFIVPLLFLAFASILAVLSSKVIQTLVLTAIVSVSAYNWNGVLYPEIAWGLENVAGIPAAALARSGAFYERSHEYLVDHESTIAAVEAIDEHRDKGDYVMAMPFPYFLAYPAFGYVDEPLIGYSVNGITGAIPKFKETADLFADKPAAPIFIKAATYFYAKQGSFQVPNPQPDDEIIYRDDLPYPLIVFRKRWPATPPSPEEIARFYDRQKWPEEQFVATVYFLLENVGKEAALGHVRSALDAESASPEQQANLKILAAALGGELDQNPAIEQTAPPTSLPHDRLKEQENILPQRFIDELRQGVREGQSHYQLGLLCLKHLRLADAAEYLRAHLAQTYRNAMG